MIPSSLTSNLRHERVDIELEDQIPLLEEQGGSTFLPNIPHQPSRGGVSIVPSRPSSTRSQPRREFQIGRRILVNNVWTPCWKYVKRQCSFGIYNLREIWKKKFGFCIGMLSCILVVLSVCVTVSVTDHMPIIFLRIAENQIGQFDSLIYSSGDYGSTVNYTKFSEVLSRSPVTNKKNILHSPRIQFYVHVIDPSQCLFPDDDDDDNNNNNEKREISRDIWNPTESREWFYGTTVTDPYGYNSNMSCPSCDVSYVCGQGFGITLFSFDTLLEKEMGFGRSWGYPKLKEGECIISVQVAAKLGLKVGDDIIILANDFGANEKVFQGWFANSGLDFRTMNFTDFIWSQDLYFEAFKFVFPLHIVGIQTSNFGGKNNAFDTDVIYMEYEYLYDHLSEFISKDFLEYQDELKKHNPYSFAQRVYLNGKNRFELYNTNDFQKVRNRVTGLIGDVMYVIGYDQFEADYPLLPVFEGLQMIGLFLGLIVDVIIAIMIGLSIILIYTLLLINVEERVFEMGVLRMVGMKLSYIFELLLMQAMMLSLPGVIFGLLLGQILYFIVALILQLLLGADVPYTITFLSIVASAFVGVAIPLVSSILPIRAAMGKRLSESLDMRRSKTKAVKVEISRMSESKISWSIIIISLSSFSFGFFIYYFLPLALITMQYQLLLLVFFAIILMSLLGLVMLCLNLERIIQLSLLKILFFWEYIAVKNMVSKNLIAHKHRNRKTTLMYGISLAFLIFISVSTGLEIKMYSFEFQRWYGTKLVMESVGTKDAEQQEFVFTLLDKYVEQSEFLEDYAYKSYPINKILNQNSHILRPVGDYYRVNIHLSMAVSTNFYEVLDKRFLVINKQDSKYEGWGVCEQLYSTEGTYGFIGDKRRRIDLGVENIATDNLVFEMKKNTNLFPKYTYKLMRFNSVLESGAASSFTKYPTEYSANAFFSFPSFFKLIENMELTDYIGRHNLNFHDNQVMGEINALPPRTVQTMMDIPIEFIYFKLKSGISKIQIEKVIEDLRNLVVKAEINYFTKNFGDVYTDDDDDGQSDLEEEKYSVSSFDYPITFNYRYHNVNEIVKQIDVIEDVMSFFFYLSTAFTMVMCFFSLVSNMYTNVQEQAMEIGILRAMGMRKWTLNRVTVYEALIIIYTSAIIGVLIGLCIGYTLVLQQQLFTQLPLTFVFPYEIVITVLIGGIICGFISSVIPINLLLFKDIVNIMRKI